MIRFGAKFAMAAIVALVATGMFAKVDARPSRSECMTAHHMNWSSVKADQGDVLNAMTWPVGDKRIVPLTAMGRSQDKMALYLLFREDCGRKWEMSRQLIDYWRTEGIDIPQLTPIEAPIQPSPFTLDVKGPFWSDGGE